ncbi:fimbrial biogenesis chaperone [Neptunicoccus cionae]|uniref:Pili assembly chaperone N-terminal domain-containing protein n=1 Tax=Neptunicoccus cionae TaxID=2035344 RepID=A0A916VPZ1_9RHOB|nr:fimbria/pilus periplasmic chaperone [Amylibacter cionae]GGA16742.1 hypothetical protein GCM10011498_16600 [Amylibacter cionae]
MIKSNLILAGAFAALLPGIVAAQSLSVSPTKLEVANGARQTTLTVKANSRGSSVLQMRVMAWKEGSDPSRLKATRDVVISPPAAKLRPRQELTVRIVRTKKRAVRKRECYRVLVDRLPDRKAKGQVVKLQVRHSLPLCFSS